MPIPPTTNAYRVAGTSGKWLRGPRTVSVRPGSGVACSSADPPRPSATRSTAIRYASRSSGRPHSEYERTRPDGRTTSTCAPGSHSGSGAPPESASVIPRTPLPPAPRGRPSARAPVLRCSSAYCLSSAFVGDGHPSSGAAPGRATPPAPARKCTARNCRATRPHEGFRRWEGAGTGAFWHTRAMHLRGTRQAVTRAPDRVKLSSAAVRRAARSPRTERRTPGRSKPPYRAPRTGSPEADPPSAPHPAARSRPAERRTPRGTPCRQSCIRRPRRSMWGSPIWVGPGR